LGLFGASESANAQTSAADTAAAANQSAAQLQYQEWLQQQQNMQPWLTSGQNALNVLNQRMGLPAVSTTAQAQGAAAPTTTNAAAGGQQYYNPQTGQITTAPTTTSQGVGEFGKATYQQPINLSSPTAAAQLKAAGWQPYGSTNQTAAAPASTSAAATGNQNSLLNIPAFSYNASTDPNLQNAANWSNNLISAQNAAAGNYGSGNMASALNQEDVGALEPTYYNQALNTYGQNLNSQYTMPYNFLASMAGYGQTAANSLANTGQAAVSNIGNYGVSGANALGAGQVGASNAYNSGLNSLLASLTAGGGNNYLSNWLSGGSQTPNYSQVNWNDPYASMYSGWGG
jgi:hypothetical protein